MKKININIKRDKSVESFEVSSTLTLLASLYEIKESKDASLTFSSGCRSAICGACAVRVNGKEKLACSYKVKDGDLIESLNYHKILRDLKVDKSSAKDKLVKAQDWIHKSKKVSLNHKDEKLTQIQSDCILCHSCYSACPVLAINPNFLGPFVLTRAYRYVVDKRESESKITIDSIQIDGVWDCTLCGECTAVCPKGIDPKMDITMLRGESLKQGYSDPSFLRQNFGIPDFSGGF
jgi:fumarate reductase iron-sulfur subunit